MSKLDVHTTEASLRWALLIVLPFFHFPQIVWGLQHLGPKNVGPDAAAPIAHDFLCITDDNEQVSDCFLAASRRQLGSRCSSLSFLNVSDKLHSLVSFAIDEQKLYICWVIKHLLFLWCKIIHFKSCIFRESVTCWWGWSGAGLLFHGVAGRGPSMWGKMFFF